MISSFFYKDGKPLTNSPVCYMTDISDGNMRFRWNEQNNLRTAKLSQILNENNWNNKSFCPVELIHSKKVYCINNSADTLNLLGDGIITQNKDIIPTITVADCVPIYIFNNKTKAFGILHSGWKGTGICIEAIELAYKKFGGNKNDFYIVIGPHIHDCCYIVNQERADYFINNFSKDCVKPLEENGKCYCGGKGLPITWNNGSGKLYRLSLLKANLAALNKAGIPQENIHIIDECTCCNVKFGSNRRETAFSQKPDSFTVQAAFICYE